MSMNSATKKTGATTIFIYFVFFNNPIVKLFSDDDPEAQFLLKSCFIDEDDEGDGEA